MLEKKLKKLQNIFPFGGRRHGRKNDRKRKTRILLIQISKGILIQKDKRSIMMASMSSSSAKKLIKIDVVADTVCPWCYVGKKNLDKAMASSSDQYNFEIKWHPYLLNPNAPKEGIPKKEFYLQRFGARCAPLEARINGIFKGLGLDNYDMTGLTGNTLDSHRLIYFAGTQGLYKQHELVEELGHGYFIRGKYIGDREYLLEAAKKVGVEGAEEFLQDPNNGLKEINEDLRRYSSQIHGVPHFTINGRQELSGGQPPESFLQVFRAAA